jgi:hypothetical protein
MACDGDRYEKTGYMLQENIKQYIMTNRKKNVICRIRTNQELWELYKYLHTVADIKK